MIRQRWWRGAKRVITVLAIFYSSVVALWFVCLLAYRDGWWLLILANFAVVEPIVPALPLWLLSLATGSRRLIATATVPLLIFGFLYWPYLVPDFGIGTDTEQPGTGRVRVMTYNILNNNDDVDAVVAIVDRYEPDVVAIQELTETIEPLLLASLADTHPHHVVAAPTRGGTTALFSRTPLDDIVEIDFGIDRPGLVAVTVVDGHEVIVASAHLNPAFYALNESSRAELPGAIHTYLADQNSQAEQMIEAILALADETGDPVIFGCDCNTRENNRTNKILSVSLTDPARDLGWPLRRPTLPGTRHERRIAHLDYIWYRPGTNRPVEVDGIYRVNDRGGSDHHPLVADFMVLSAD